MKLTCSILLLLILTNCSPTIKPHSLEDAKIKLEKVNYWYKSLVKEKLPSYVYETKVYNDNGSYNGNVFRYYTIEENKNYSDFDSLFIKSEFRKIKKYLLENQKYYYKVFLQIPVVKNEYSANSKTLYVEQHKVIGELMKKHYYFDNSISNLVTSSRFTNNLKKDFIPTDVMKLVFKSFENAKAVIKFESKEIKKSKLTIGERPSLFSPSKLYLNNDGKNVYLSPFLLRAVLVKTLSNLGVNILEYDQSNFKNDRPVILISTDDLKRKYNVPKSSFFNSKDDFIYDKKTLILDRYDKIIKEIESTFTFLFVHEFAHIYLKTTDEEQCDCLAFRLLKKDKTNFNFGVFQKILVEAMKSNNGVYWINDIDSIQIQNVINRYSKLKQADSLYNSGKIKFEEICIK